MRTVYITKADRQKMSDDEVVICLAKHFQLGMALKIAYRMHPDKIVIDYKSFKGI